MAEWPSAAEFEEASKLLQRMIGYIFPMNEAMKKNYKDDTPSVTRMSQALRWGATALYQEAERRRTNATP